MIINPRSPDEVHSDGETCNSMWERIVLVEGDLADIDTLLALMHEIGHVVIKDTQAGSETRQRAFKRFDQNMRLGNRDAAAVLREERDAWAFALKKLRPLITSENWPKIKSAIHDDALHSYNQDLRDSLFPGWLARLLKYLSEIIGADIYR